MIDSLQDPGLTARAEVRRRPTRRVLVTLALLAPLIAVGVYLLASSPLANAAGGCGGG